MAGTDDGKIACPTCGKQYRWKPELAGRKVACKCGQTMRMPEHAPRAADPAAPAVKPSSPKSEAPKKAPPPADDGAYELNLDEPEPKTAAPPKPVISPPASASRPIELASPAGPPKCPNCNAVVKIGAVICIQCGFHLASGEKIKTAVHVGDDPAAPPTAAAPVAAAAAIPKLGGLLADTAKRVNLVEADAAYQARKAKWQEVYVPAILAGIGAMLLLFNIFALEDVQRMSASMSTASGNTPSMALVFGLLFIRDAIMVGLQIPALFVGILVVARLFGSSFGPITVAMLKLMAITLVTSGVFNVVNSLMVMFSHGIVGGGLVGLALNYGLFWVLAVWLFELDPIEFQVLYFVSALLPIFVAGYLSSFLMIL